jgi:hypothetical protein
VAPGGEPIARLSADRLLRVEAPRRVFGDT